MGNGAGKGRPAACPGKSRSLFGGRRRCPVRTSRRKASARRSCSALGIGGRRRARTCVVVPVFPRRSARAIDSRGRRSAAMCPNARRCPRLLLPPRGLPSCQQLPVPPLLPRMLPRLRPRLPLLKLPVPSLLPCNDTYVFEQRLYPLLEETKGTIGTL